MRTTTRTATAFFAALAAQGDRAPVVAFPDGGDSSYWHDRADGKWASYVLDEVIPPWRSSRIDPTGSRSAASRWAASGPLTGAGSPGHVLRGRRALAGAVHGRRAERGRRFRRRRGLRQPRLIAAAAPPGNPYTQLPPCGSTKATTTFVPGDDAFIANLQAARGDPTHHVWPGGHDGDYWAAHWDDYLPFYAKELARC